MEKFTETLRRDVERQLVAIERSAADEMAKAHGATILLEKAFSDLKKFIIENDFSDQSEEIRFFKKIKPRLFCHLIYHRKVYNIAMNRPTGSDHAQADYLRREQERLKDFFNKNLGFYQYHRSGGTHMDKEYFTRGGADRLLVGETFYFERDPRFSTPCDFKVAKILANDRLQVWLEEEINRLERPAGSILNDLPKEKHTWTEKKIKLIELIYALEAVGCTNDGRLSIREMIRYTELTLNIDLGNTTQYFYEMCRRSNPTQFLDELREALIKRIEEINGSDPKPKKK